MRRFFSIGSMVVVLVALLAAPSGGILAAARPGGDVIQVDPGPPGPGEARHPLVVKVQSRDQKGNPAVTNPAPSGYTPSQIQSYLGLSGNGAGMTIAIVDAYDHPNIANDLNVFSKQFNLPLICGTSGADSSNCVKFTKATPQGKTRTNAGWALEIALDVEWAHAVAPNANILLVEARSASYSNLLSAIDYAAKQSGVVVISNSWGSNEFSGENSFDYHCALSTAVCTFSSGDSGNPGGYPAYSPYVVAVGGTTLYLTSSGAVQSETAWTGSGGGVSQVEPKPSYQNNVNPYPRRGMPDVSYNADPNTGFPVYDSVPYAGQTGWFQVGGTSAGAPQWAAIIAVADQLRAGAGKAPLSSATMQTNKDLYGLSSGLYDVAIGSNGNCGTVCTAGPGYDFVTGLGSPRVGIDIALAAAP